MHLVMLWSSQSIKTVIEISILITNVTIAIVLFKYQHCMYYNSYIIVLYYCSVTSFADINIAAVKLTFQFENK